MATKSDAPVGWISGYQSMADYCGVSKRTIGRWIEGGKLKVRNLSPRKTICRPADLDRAVETVCDDYEWSREDD